MIALLWFFGERAIEDRLQLPRGASGTRFAQRLRLLVQHCMPHVDTRLSLKRPGASQHFVKQNAGRENVRPRIDAFAARLFRSGVCRGAVGNADFSQVSVMNAPGARAVVDQLGQTEIENFHLARRSDHHVAGCDSGAADELTNVLTLDVLHGNEVNALDVVQIKNGADIRVIKRRGQTRLALEPFQVGFFDS